MMEDGINKLRTICVSSCRGPRTSRVQMWQPCIRPSACGTSLSFHKLKATRCQCLFRQQFRCKQKNSQSIEFFLGIIICLCYQTLSIPSYSQSIVLRTQYSKCLPHQLWSPQTTSRSSFLLDSRKRKLLDLWISSKVKSASSTTQVTMARGFL